LTSGLRDADSQSRKLSRLLFRFSRELDLWSRALLSILDDMDGSVLKLIQTENLTNELVALRVLSKDNYALEVDSASCGGKTVSLSIVDEEQTAKLPATTPMTATTTTTIGTDSITSHHRLADRRLSVMGPKRNLPESANGSATMSTTTTTATGPTTISSLRSATTNNFTSGSAARL
jgi:hypothetical protein